MTKIKKLYLYIRVVKYCILYFLTADWLYKYYKEDTIYKIKLL